MIAIVVVVCSILFLSGTYIIWPSRWNIGAHLSLGLGLVGYVIPVFVTGMLDFFPQDIVRFYAKLLAVGAAFYVLGLAIGARIPVSRLVRSKLSFSSLPYQVFESRTQRRTVLLLTLGLIGMLVCFYSMGFIPMFAEDPFTAKYFRGAYEEPFKRVAWSYRLCDSVVIVLLPVAYSVWYSTRRFSHLFLSVVGTGILTLTLARGPMASGLLVFLGLVAAGQRKRKWFWAYIAVVLFLYPFGAAFYHIFGYVFGLDKYMVVQFDTPWELITRGSPDVSDQLNLLGAFLDYGSFTYGRTFVGGLLPGSGNSRWNPSIWAMTLVSGGWNKTNLSELGGGGFRLPVSMWGYTAFGWPGAVAVSFLSGLILGWATGFVKKFIDEKSILKSIVAMTLYGTLGGQLATFYWLSIYTVPQILVALLLTYRGKPIAAGLEQQRAYKSTRVGQSQRVFAPRA
jgi:hypothetical protein